MRMSFFNIFGATILSLLAERFQAQASYVGRIKKHFSILRHVLEREITFSKTEDV